MKTPKCNKLILSIAIAITAGVFLFAGHAFAGNYYIWPNPYDYGTTETTHEFTLDGIYGSGMVGVKLPMDWVDVHNFNGDLNTRPHTFEMSVDRGWLLAHEGPGTYYEAVTFYTWSPYAEYYVNISVTVLVPAAMSVTPTSHDFGASGTSKQFTVQNTGETTLNWQIDQGLLPPWITMSTYSGSLGNGASQNVTATVDRSGLEGTYPGTISFTSNGGNTNVTISMKALFIAGYVREGNGNGIGGVTVNVGSHILTTDSTPGNEGYYKQNGFSSGTYSMSASYLDYVFSPLPHDLTLTNVSRDDVHFYTYDIFGYIRRHDLGGGGGINGINVRITGGNAGIDEPLTTTNGPDGPGYYILEHVGGGTYTIEAQNP